MFFSFLFFYTTFYIEKEEYSQKGVIEEGDVTSGYHCMTIPYLSDQLERSLKNLDVECIDLLYLHNAVEGQIKDVSKEKFLENLKPKQLRADFIRWL